MGIGAGIDGHDRSGMPFPIVSSYDSVPADTRTDGCFERDGCLKRNPGRGDRGDRGMCGTCTDALTLTTAFDRAFGLQASKHTKRAHRNALDKRNPSKVDGRRALGRPAASGAPLSGHAPA